MFRPSEISERGAEGLTTALCHALTTPRRPANRGPYTIAISRQPGTQGSALAVELGRRLGWPVYDRQLIEKVAQDMGLRAQFLDSVDEKPVSWFRESIDALTTGTVVSERAFVRRLVETMLALGAHGHCVIVGRGSAHVLPADTTLRVRLVASRPDRILAVQAARQMTADQAARWVDETDRERSAFIREHFLRDISDPGWYDVILNATRWSVPQCAEIVIETLNRLEVSA